MIKRRCSLKRSCWRGCSKIKSGEWVRIRDHRHIYSSVCELDAHISFASQPRLYISIGFIIIGTLIKCVALLFSVISLHLRIISWGFVLICVWNTMCLGTGRSLMTKFSESLPLCVLYRGVILFEVPVLQLGQTHW